MPLLFFAAYTASMTHNAFQWAGQALEIAHSPLPLSNQHPSPQIQVFVLHYRARYKMYMFVYTTAIIMGPLFVTPTTDCTRLLSVCLSASNSK